MLQRRHPSRENISDLQNQREERKRKGEREREGERAKSHKVAIEIFSMVLYE